MLHHGTFHMLARHRICMIGPPLRRFVLSRCFPPLLQPFRLVGPQSEEGRVSTEMRSYGSSHTYFDDHKVAKSNWSVLQLAHKQYVIRCKFDWSACTKLRKLPSSRLLMGNRISGEHGEDGSRSSSQKKEELDSSLPPKFTEKYEVIGKLGRGSFGHVYKVRDPRTKAVYAAKQVEYNESNMKEVRPSD